MMNVRTSTTRTPLTANHIRGFWAAWGGWALDGMDSFIYALVLTPALTELLPKSDIPATPGNVGFYGSVLFALFLIGWGLSMVWGPIADRFGRVRTLALTILCYSAFTFAAALATNLWHLAAFRLPTSVTQIAMRDGYSGADAARLASYGTMILSAGTIVGCLVLPLLADAYGRRFTLGLYFAIMLVSIAVGFGYVFYLPHALTPFMMDLFTLGVGGANFAMYTLWLPEQYATDCRASAFAFATSVGRFAGAGITFLVGAGVQHFHTIGTPVALTSLAFAVGLLLLPFGEETRGKPLPA